MTDDKNEREHRSIEVGHIPSLAPYVGEDLMVRIHILEAEDLILSERAAADKAGYERGRAESIQEEFDAHQAELAHEHECSMQGLAVRDTLRARLTKLQSRYMTLAAAAHKLFDEVCKNEGRVSVGVFRDMKAALEASSVPENEGEDRS